MSHFWDRGTGLGQKGTVHVSCCCPRTTAGHMNRPLLSRVPQKKIAGETGYSSARNRVWHRLAVPGVVWSHLARLASKGCQSHPFSPCRPVRSLQENCARPPFKPRMAFEPAAAQYATEREEEETRGIVLVVRVTNAAKMTKSGLLLTINQPYKTILEDKSSFMLHMSHKLLFSCHEIRN